MLLVVLTRYITICVMLWARAADAMHQLHLVGLVSQEAKMGFAELYQSLRVDVARQYSDDDEPSEDELALADFDIDLMSHTELLQALAIRDEKKRRS